MKISKNNCYLLLIVILALILRLIAAHHTHVSTDEMIYSIIPLNIISAGRLGTVEQSPLAFYLTDIGYQLFGGVSGITVRLPAIIFGTLATVVIYLICSYLWNRNSGLISSFLFAVSGYALAYNYETDMASFFFAALALYWLIRYLREKKSYLFYLSAISFGLGILIKPLIILFVPALALLFLYYLIKLKWYKDKPVIKTTIIGLLLGIAILMPVISYNYLVYQEKGITDAYVSQFFGLGETVHTGLESKPWESEKFWVITAGNLKNNFVKKDLVIFIFGLLGMVYSLRSSDSGWPRPATAVIILMTLTFHLRVAGQTGSSSHYLWYPLMFSIFSGVGIVTAAEYIKNKFKFKQLAALLMIGALISLFFVMGDIISQRKESITLSLRDYVRDEITEQAVVVIDPRIYRGIHAWVFNDRHYLEGTNFGALVQQIKASPEQKLEVDLFYVECSEGTRCGWKPEDFARINDSGAAISKYFQENTLKVKEIRAGHNFNIYSGKMVITPGAYEAIDRTHAFWFYPVGWKYLDNVIDNYTARGWGVWFNFIGFAMLWIDVILALLVMPLTLYLGFKAKPNENNSNE